MSMNCHLTTLTRFWTVMGSKMLSLLERQTIDMHRPGIITLFMVVFAITMVWWEF